MIDRIVVENFKSLRRVDLKLGRMNLLIGANASGKSNFLDALRVLQGIGAGFTISEILDGKPKSATSEVWDGIRGGSSKACYAAADGSGAVTIEAHGRFEDGASRTWELRIAFSPTAGQVTHEQFNVDSQTVYAFASNLNAWSQNLFFQGPTSVQPWLGRLAAGIPGLQVGKEGGVPARHGDGKLAFGIPDLPQEMKERVQKYVDPAAKVAALLANAQRLDPSPAALREYSRSHHVRRLGDHGENFAALVRTIGQNDVLKDAYLAWLRQLRPEEVEDVGTLSGAVGEPMFMLRENGREFPAPVLSDGTLRFAAITAAFFQDDMPGLLTIEEIEKGLHASRVQVLLELLRSQAEVTGTQVVATTHSAAVLDWLQEEDYKTTFLFRRDETTGESRVRPLADVPRFMDVVKKKPVSELFSEGWMEMAP